MKARHAFAALLSAAGFAATPGCVWYGPHSMTRLWADHNTLNRGAFFLERLSHSPPPRERVERFRWQYGVGPGVPFTAPELPVIAPQAAADPVSTPNDLGVPPAPPPEPLPPLAEPAAGQFVPPPQPLPSEAGWRRARPNLAWMFAPARG